MPYNANKNEQEILEYWEKIKAFERSVSERPEDKPYVFYDGPPFATGLPHYGHILSSVIKDVVPRYMTMKGYRVRRRWGWDCHGLPIESLIEKELNISGKKNIEDNITIAGFNEACKSKVLMYTKEWKKMVDRVGRWVEFDTAYKTMDPTYMESVWWGLKKIWDDGRIYEGRKVLMYCTRCETPVSKAEIAMDNSYKDVTEEAVTVKFEVKNQKSKIKSQLDVDLPMYFLAWTTTPWTLPGNVALAVGNEIEYAVVREKGMGNREETYVMAKARLDHVMHGREYEVVRVVQGADLVGLEYEPLFDIPAVATTGKKAHYVTAADFVTTEEGTGIVHTAVIYGEDDYNLGLAIDLPMAPLLLGNGHFNADAPEFIRGEYLKKAQGAIKADLEHRGLLFSREQYTHSYPHCWRCDTPLIYNAISAWFIDIQSIKPRLIELNEKIAWYPEHLKHGRFLNILETAPDWNISRNRYWATPLPFWRCVREKGIGNREEGVCPVVCIGSIQELKEKAVNFDEVYATDRVEDMDLHKHYMDRILLKCETCGGNMERIPEVIDCWVEAASMPYAEFHYPFENKKTFHGRFPGQFIAEYINQTRAWFYYMHAIATLLFDDVSFEHVVTTGVILNEKGEKMSKSKKNYPDPWIIIEQYGVDALRYYLMSSPVMQADNLFFSERGVRDVYNNVINTLSNVLAFYSTYADHMPHTTYHLSSNVLDMWILAKVNVLVKEVTEQMSQYNVVSATRPMKDFIEDFSTWYIRRSRERFKQGTSDGDAALATLREVLLILSKVMAPFTPFIAEKIYRAVGGEMDSVHLELWPDEERGTRNEERDVMTEMSKVRKIVEMGHALRKEAGIAVRQPLSQLQIATAKAGQADCRLQIAYLDIIGEELNVKEIKNNKKEEKDGRWIIKEDGDLAVALNIEMTDELKKEGLIREVTRAVNQMRKDQMLKPSDRIILSYQTDNMLLRTAMEEYARELLASIGAHEMREESGGEIVTIGEVSIALKIEKVG